ncbi:MAG TPA: L-aspartate oxidase [Candidatus Saccharimonadales bacterium]|nr:L-aspartate oxidase [Candidatus Saccharimonadales bacterium]
MQKITDFIVIGSGIAGLNTARILATYGSVILITKGSIRDSATSYAQGGIAAVFDEKDSIESHIQDTLLAGRNHNNKDAVTFLVQRGKEAIQELLSIGVPFDKKPNGFFATSFEAAHTYPRIFHATDFTGQAIEEALVASILSNKNIEVWENTFVSDLIVENNQCFGVEIRNAEPSYIFARATILASGGAGQIYQWTVTPSVATGDGVAMAYRAGANLADLEFFQFHPTALQEQEGQKYQIDTPELFLLSEALRGEGAILVDSHGVRFMEHIHPQAELSPRDVVSRAIFKKQKESTVYLDIRHKGKKFLTSRFPNIFEALQKRGFDLATDLIPVTPAAHFLCGGIVTDLYGKTSIKNLFAYGEVSATGVHGANRLASNSLLEGFVFSSQIKKCINELPKKAKILPIKTMSYQKIQENYDIRKKLREIMWNYVGIERSEKSLAFAIKEITAMHVAVREMPVTETKNMIQVSLLIAEAAYSRKKSLGAHYMTQ